MACGEEAESSMTCGEENSRSLAATPAGEGVAARVPKLGEKALTGPPLVACRRALGLRGGGMKEVSLYCGTEGLSVLVSAVMLRLEMPESGAPMGLATGVEASEL